MTVQFPYLEDEDARFARAFRLSEDEALEMFGGLKGYTQHRLDRAKARRNGSEVPSLPSSIESQLESIKFTELSEKQWAKHLVSEQMGKVQGITDGMRITKRFQEEVKRDTENKAIVKDQRIKELQEESAARYGWSSDSQSAKDWATAEYERRYKGQ